MGELRARPLVANVMDDLVVLAAVDPPTDGHQLLCGFRMACPAAHFVLGQLAIGALAVAPHQSFDV
jgi:hypothetical protein